MIFLHEARIADTTQASVRQRNSITSTNLKMQRTRTESSANRMRSNSNLTCGSFEDDEDVVHPVEARARTAMLPPVLVSKTHDGAKSQSQLTSAGQERRRAPAVLAGL